MEEGSERRMQKRERRLDPSLPNHDSDEEEEQRLKKMRSQTIFSEICGAPAFRHLLETSVRRTVKEAVDAAFLRHLEKATGSCGCSTEQRDGPHQRNLQLQFKSDLSSSLYTERNIEAIKVVLLDAFTGSVITSGPESSVKLLAVVLQGDFNSKDEEDWTKEEFESHVVKEREGKRPLLLGNQKVTLNEGVGTLTNLFFTDNSSWVRSKMFRIGLKVAPDYCVGSRIREAKTNAFTVKDHRGESNKKHYPPALDDHVWRLEKIGKDGKFHNRLNKAGICTVKDFLRHLVRDPKELKHILGATNKTWSTFEEHAKTCHSNGKQYVYYPDDSKEVGVIFNDVYKLKGLIRDGYNWPADSLSDDKEVYANNLIIRACDDLGRITEYDEILDHEQNIAGTQRTPYDTFDRRLPPTCFTPTIRGRPTVEEGLLLGGISNNENPTTERLVPSQNLNSHFHLQFGGSSSSFQSTSHQTNILRNDSMLGLAPGSLHSSISGLNNGFPSNLPADSFFDCLSILSEENPVEQVDHNVYDMLQGHYDAKVYHLNGTAARMTFKCSYQVYHLNRTAARMTFKCSYQVYHLNRTAARMTFKCTCQVYHLNKTASKVRVKDFHQRKLFQSGISSMPSSCVSSESGTSWPRRHKKGGTSWLRRHKDGLPMFFLCADCESMTPFAAVC